MHKEYGMNLTILKTPRARVEMLYKFFFSFLGKEFFNKKFFNGSVYIFAPK